MEQLDSSLEGRCSAMDMRNCFGLHGLEQMQYTKNPAEVMVHSKSFQQLGWAKVIEEKQSRFCEIKGCRIKPSHLKNLRC